MKKIEEIGKKLPYGAPEGSLDRMSEELFGLISASERQRKRRRIMRLVSLNSAALVAIVLALGFYLRKPNDVVAKKYEIDNVLKSLSDEELCRLETIATADPFK